MKLFPAVSKQTVIFFPSRTKLNTSPYYAPSVHRATDFKLPPHLCLVLKEELVRVHAIGDSASDDREPVEHHRRLPWVFEKELLEYIENYREDNEGDEAGRNDSRI